MGRLVPSLLAILLVASAADARTSGRKCRKACKPLVSAVCPPKGKALRKCRTPIIKECRREGLATCTLGLPTGGRGDGTTMPSPTTTTTTTVSSPTTTSTTTTLPPPHVPAVAGNWMFEGVLLQAGCDLDTDISSVLMVQQDGTALSGTIGDGDMDRPATGAVDGGGWTFTWEAAVPSDPTCTQHFTVHASGYSSPAAARATAAASCSGGFTCQARWTGSLTRAP